MPWAAPVREIMVFPAYAGMFLCRTFKPERKLCFPRVCKFSPRMRGCSVLVTLSFSEDKVFPAYAGMFRVCVKGFQKPTCFPRVCGDVTLIDAAKRYAALFSPRMRGCSLEVINLAGIE